MDSLRFIVFVLCIFFLVSMCNGNITKWTNEIEGQDATMESHIGDTVILAGDSLVVSNYSMWNSEYILSNGATVARKLVEDGE